MSQAATSKCEQKMESRQKSGSFSSRSSEDFSETSFDGESDGLVGSATHHLVLFAMTKGHTRTTLTRMPPAQLAEFLREFYGKVRAKLDDSSPALRDIRLGLHKYFLKEAGFDIIKDRTFYSANASYEMAVRMGPRKCHRLRIEMDDLQQLYLSDAMNVNNPESLQNKVFFDINLYILNRGKECLRVMTKTDFEIATDESGNKFVWLKYHPKFNLHEKGGYGDIKGKQLGEKMFERPGDPRCPVLSFVKYMAHLHPMTDAFWQRPKRNVSDADYVWYDNTSLGNSTLSKIMQRMCIHAGLKENYTNHSIRSSYIPLIETICQDTLNSGKSSAMPPPLVTQTNSVADDDGSSNETESRDGDHEEDNGDDQSVGLQAAKLKVLQLLRNLLVKDIQKFADWLKTVRVEHRSGELIVLCSPVNQTSVDLADECSSGDKSDHTLSSKKICSLAGMHDKIRQNGKSGSFSSTSSGSSCSMDIGGNNFHSDRNHSLYVREGVSVKNVEFDSIAGTSCSTNDSCPFKLTIPAQDTLLMTGITDNMQILLHKKTNESQEKELLSHRIFYSENEMDIATILGSCDSQKARHDSDLLTGKQTKHAIKKTTVMQKVGGKYDTCIKLDAGSQKQTQVVNEKKNSHQAMKLNPCLKRQARIEGGDNQTDITLPKRFCKSNSDVTTSCGSTRIQSVPTGSLDTPNYTRSFDFSDESIMSSPLMKKKRVTFGSDAQNMSVKRESVL